MKEEKHQEYAVFTKEMKDDYTILAPSMLPIHFKILARIMEDYGYHIVFCGGERTQIVQEGLKSTHNDICYPAMLVVGQMLSELKKGDYDPHKTALIMTQTGGGCRASNYIHLIRKALENQKMDYVPVISANLSGLENHPGFQISLGLAVKLVAAMFYGDLLMLLSNQCKPYEQIKGMTQQKLETWIVKLSEMARHPQFLCTKNCYKQIIDDFNTIPRENKAKPKVGIVGEIYMKYSPLGNNYLEAYLESEGAEVVMSGLSDFMMYCMYHGKLDRELYGKGGLGSHLGMAGYHYIHREQRKMIKAIEASGVFRAPTDFTQVRALGEQFIGLGVKMGEGWLLTAEMLELIQQGVNNVVCAQPFGCLPNHIVGKGMLRKIKEAYPEANITAIDFDPSESKVNQENRIKLMLANCKVS
ncbi:MAG: hypothetical protein ACRCW2_15415 [Cellulosilyticaceae bacterium]